MKQVIRMSYNAYSIGDRTARVPVSARDVYNTYEWLDNLNIGKKRQYTNMDYDDA